MKNYLAKKDEILKKNVKLIIKEERQIIKSQLPTFASKMYQTIQSPDYFFMSHIPVQNVSASVKIKRTIKPPVQEKPQKIDRGVLFMKRLEDEGATVYMKDADRDMINAFNNDDQLQGL